MFLHGQPLLCQLRSHLGQNKIFLHMGQNIAILGPVWYFSLVSCKKNNLILYFNWPKHIIGLHGKFQVKYYILALLRTYSLRHFRLTSLFTFCFHALVSILAYFRKLLKLNDIFSGSAIPKIEFKILAPAWALFVTFSVDTNFKQRRLPVPEPVKNEKPHNH